MVRIGRLDHTMIPRHHTSTTFIADADAYPDVVQVSLGRFYSFRGLEF